MFGRVFNFAIVVDVIGTVDQDRKNDWHLNTNSYNEMYHTKTRNLYRMMQISRLLTI